MSHHPDVISGKITAKEAYQQFLSHFDTHSSSTRTSKVLAVSYAVGVLMFAMVIILYNSKYVQRVIAIRIACRISRTITALSVRR